MLIQRAYHILLEGLKWVLGDPVAEARESRSRPKTNKAAKNTFLRQSPPPTPFSTFPLPSYLPLTLRGCGFTRQLWEWDQTPGSLTLERSQPGFVIHTVITARRKLHQSERNKFWNERPSFRMWWVTMHRTRRNFFYAHFKMADIYVFKFIKHQTFKIKHCFTVWLQGLVAIYV